MKCVRLSCTWQRLLHHLPLDCGFRWLKHTAFQGGDLSSSEPSTAIVENIKSHWHSTVKKMPNVWNMEKNVFVEKTKIKGGSKELRTRIAGWLTFVSGPVVTVRPEDGGSKIDETSVPDSKDR